MEIAKAIKKIEPFVAIGIFLLLLFLSFLLYQENKITEKISENCGWGEEDFYCFCEKSTAQELKNLKLNSSFIDDDFKISP